MSWFTDLKSPKIKNDKKMAPSNTPSGPWNKCNQCSEIIQISKLEENSFVCLFCDYHYRVKSQLRLGMLIDKGSFSSFGDNLQSKNPLNFVDSKNYPERLKGAQDKTGLNDSVLAGTGLINGTPVSIGIMDFNFMGGSMGVVAGEKIAMVFDAALEKKIPAIVISCSGGARMQEGILSLMQLAKTSASRQRLRSQNIPYLSILSDPTTGGCAASFAMQGDLILAEPNALVGFAGPRVIEQSIRQTLPEGFQRSEFLLSHGQVDAIIHRRNLKKELSFYLNIFGF